MTALSTETICARYKATVASGGDVGALVGELAACLGVQRPAIWRRLRSGGALPPYAKRQDGGPGYTAARRKRSLLKTGALDFMPARVDRDPCGFCGTRADVSCRHRSPA